MKEIILASSSIYRKQQLESLGVTFTTESPGVDEEPLKIEGIDHVELSQKLSLLKAKAVSDKNKTAIVIGGDQVASFNNTILSKPKTKEKSFEQLKTLSGNEHRLITSLAIVSDNQEHVHTCIAKMKMRKLSDDQITRYIETDEPFQCCGSYRLESLGISLFDAIECNDHTSIIGIPLMWTARLLSDLGLQTP